jgi:ABC-type dipeptide/oligopeptide/nickel transport system ATPase component
MRQRVMIALALSCEPKLIIADEPTTALDVTIQAQILELMKDLSRRLGVALIIITHNLGVVARYADRVNVMYAGKIVEMGTSEQVYHDPKHPYTVGLLASVLDAGCSYRPRCRWAIERCASEFPPLEDAGDNHVSACWRVQEMGELRKETL